MKPEPGTVTFEAEVSTPTFAEVRAMFDACEAAGLYAPIDRVSLAAMYAMDSAGTARLIADMAARVMRCRRCTHFRRPGLADSGYCAGAREDLPVVYGLLRALPADGGAWCPLFASKEARP